MPEIVKKPKGESMKFHLTDTELTLYCKGDQPKEIPEGAYFEWEKKNDAYKKELYIDISTAEELLSFAEKADEELIIIPAGKGYFKDGIPGIEIYNDYRE